MIDADISISVSDVNEYIKKTLEEDENLHYLYVKGEISNYKVASNGAAYFSLSDDKSTISCVIFSNYRQALKFNPANGDDVKVIASLSVYAPRGTYSLRVYNIEKKGLGDALVELEKLKKKLASEGLFDDSKKKPINQYPKKIGIITALNSAALKDLIFNIQRRFPIVDIYIFPSSVQGESAPKELLEAYKASQEYDLDTLIIGRGGGSSEDLSAFNDETLIRALASRKCPIISAVGHEIDMTLIDLIADKRASTPTGAAEIATPNRDDIEERLIQSDLNIKDAIKQKLKNYENNFIFLKNQLGRTMDSYLNNLQNTIKQKSNHLDDLNPMKILSRGYSITLNENGSIIKSIKQVKINESIDIKLSDGTIRSQINEVLNKNEK